MEIAACLVRRGIQPQADNSSSIVSLRISKMAESMNVVIFHMTLCVIRVHGELCSNVL